MNEGTDSLLGQPLDVQGQAPLPQGIEPLTRLQNIFYEIISRNHQMKFLTKSGIVPELDHIVCKSQVMHRFRSGRIDCSGVWSEASMG